MHSRSSTLIHAPTIVVEGPESLSLLLYSAAGAGDQKLIDVTTSALASAAFRAADSLAQYYPVAGVDEHLVATGRPSYPRPHVHVHLDGRVDRYTVVGHARLAHVLYQNELQLRLVDGGVGVTRGYPSPCGWEVTALIEHLTGMERIRCGDSPRTLYPYDLEAAALEIRQRAAG